MNKPSFDLITLGRVGIDLYSENVGAPFEEAESFAAAVGGSPTNIAIGCSRLGLKVAAVTAVGEDQVGSFVLHYLQKEGVETAHISQKENCRTGLAMLAVQPPDHFPLTFYRSNPADIYVSIEDLKGTPIAESRALLLSGAALSRGNMREATLYAAEHARLHGLTTFVDLDLRIDLWSHPLAYGVMVRALLPLADVVIGTEEEICAALDPAPGQVMEGGRINESQKRQIPLIIQEYLSKWTEISAVVVKEGAKGSTVYTPSTPPIGVSGFPVEVLNTVGAGDAFASGLIYGRLQGWDWYKSARMGNACGAIVVTRHGCAAALPYEKEALELAGF